MFRKEGNKENSEDSRGESVGDVIARLLRLDRTRFLVVVVLMAAGGGLTFEFPETHGIPYAISIPLSVWIIRSGGRK